MFRKVMWTLAALLALSLISGLWMNLVADAPKEQAVRAGLKVFLYGCFFVGNGIVAAALIGHFRR